MALVITLIFEMEVPDGNIFLSWCLNTVITQFNSPALGEDYNFFPDLNSLGLASKVLISKLQRCLMVVNRRCIVAAQSSTSLSHKGIFVSSFSVSLSYWYLLM